MECRKPVESKPFISPTWPQKRRSRYPCIDLEVGVCKVPFAKGAPYGVELNRSSS